MEALMNNLGIVFRKAGVIKRTIKKSNTTAKSNSKSAKHIMQGNAFYNLGMFKKAIRSYNRALKINPHEDKIHINLAHAYKSLGMFKEAVKSYKYVVHTKPNSSNAHYYLGLVYGKLGMHKQAINSLQQAITIDYKNANAHYNLAVIHLTLEDNDAAINEYKILNTLAPEMAGRLTEMMSGNTV